jgi:hypothetical protein
MADHDEGTLFRYSVFISYSRKDIDFARKLEDALESYRPPRHLPVPRRHLKVFRDESDFTGGEYSAALDRNLRDASKLLVICSPNSRASGAVNQEIERFSAYRGTENIIPVLLAGVPNNKASPEQEDKGLSGALVHGCDAARGRYPRHLGFERPNRSLRTPWHKLLADVYADYRVTRDQVAAPKRAANRAPQDLHRRHDGHRARPLAAGRLGARRADRGRAPARRGGASTQRGPGARKAAEGGHQPPDLRLSR